MEHLKDALSQARPGFTRKLKGLVGTNTLAYYKHLYITDVKSFIILVPGCTWNT